MHNVEKRRRIIREGLVNGTEISLSTAFSKFGNVCHYAINIRRNESIRVICSGIYGNNCLVLIKLYTVRMDSLNRSS